MAGRYQRSAWLSRVSLNKCRRLSGGSVLVHQVRSQPPFRVLERYALAGGVVGELVSTDAPHPEVAARGVPEVVAGHGRPGPHRVRLGEADAGPRLRFEQIEQRRLLGVVRAGRIARRGSDALVA